MTALVVGLVVCLATLPAPIAAASEGPPSVSDVDTTATATAESTLVVTDSTVEPGTTATHRIALTDAPDGLAGFELTLELSGDGETATVTNASYPDAYGLTTDPITSANGQSVTVEAVDLTDEVTAGATDVTLATIDVNGTNAGSTALEVTEMQVDADGGDRIEPSLESGTLTVGENGPEAASAQNEGTESADGTAADGPNGSDGSGSESIPGFAAGSAIGAMAVLAAVLLARSR